MQLLTVLKLCIFCICGFLASIGYSQTIEDARTLTTDLLANYSPMLRPIRNQSEAIHVNTWIQLITVLEFDEVRGTLSIVAVLYMEWIDQLMNWNPEDYGGVKYVQINSDRVWTPTLTLLNNVDKIQKIGYEDSWLMVNYQSDGLAIYYPGGVFSSKCNVDVTYFPWDKHKCLLQFTTWGLRPEQMSIILTEETVLMQYYSENGAWRVVSTSVHTIGNNFNCYITMARKPLFVVVNVIFPVVVLSLLNSVVFCIPVESGERLSFSITMVLSIAVFLTIVGDNLPKVSNPMSIFSYYLGSVLILGVFITLANVYSVRMYYRTGKFPPKSYWIRLTRCVQLKCVKCCYNSGEQTNKSMVKDRQRFGSNAPKSENKENYHNDMLNSTNTGLKSKHSISVIQVDDTIDTDNDQANNGQLNNDQHDDDVSWKDISIAVDTLCSIVCVVMTLGLTLMFFFIIWIGGETDV